MKDNEYERHRASRAKSMKREEHGERTTSRATSMESKQHESRSEMYAIDEPLTFASDIPSMLPLWFSSGPLWSVSLHGGKIVLLRALLGLLGRRSMAWLVFPRQDAIVGVESCKIK